MANNHTEALSKSNEPRKVDRKFYNTIYAEVGGGPPEEVAAVASVFLNRIATQGYEKALKGSSAYRKQSNEYKKADMGKMTAYEKAIYARNSAIIDTLLLNPTKVLPYTHFENVDAFGEPSWATGQKGVDIGRQRFYIIEE